MAILLHRLLGMPTPLALNLFAVAFVLSAFAIVLGIIALIDVWRRGVPGFAWALIGIAVAGAIYVWPLSYAQTYFDLPRINDVTTDVTTPPPLIALAHWRVKSANAASYPAASHAKVQLANYPDIRPLLVNRSLEDTFEIALATLKKAKFQIVAEAPPGRERPGLIEAVDRTLVVGFYDDVIVRVGADRGLSRIDIRSSSRYGAHDFGRNAQRVRRLLSDLQARIDASVPTVAARGKSPGLKQREEKARSKINRRKAQTRKSRDRRN